MIHDDRIAQYSLDAKPREKRDGMGSANLSPLKSGQAAKLEQRSVFASPRIKMQSISSPRMVELPDLPAIFLSHKTAKPLKIFQRFFEQLV